MSCVFLLNAGSRRCFVTIVFSIAYSLVCIVYVSFSGFTTIGRERERERERERDGTFNYDLF